MKRLAFGWRLGILLGIALVLGGPSGARAAGLQLLEQSPRLTGTAYSGTAAWAADASMAFFNPAGLTRLEGGSMVVGGYIIEVGDELHADQATTWGQNISGAGGSMTVDGGSVNAFPIFHFAQRISEDWVGYIGVTVPFGNNTDYADDSVARYMGTLSKLQTININPAIAWEPIEGFSIAAGFNAMYARARLNQVAAVPTFPIVPALDVNALFFGDDWAFGWNIGALYEPSPNLRFGVAYRSAVHSTLTGSAEIYPPSIVASNPLYELLNLPNPESGTSRFGLSSPDSVTVSGFWTPVEWLDVMADFQWTQWSIQQELELSFETKSFKVPLVEKVLPQAGNIPSIALGIDLPVAFRNAYRGTIGVQMRPAEDWSIRIGTGYDGSPTQAANRTVRLPDANRWILSFGFGWEFLENVFFDFGYAHFFGGTVPLNETLSLPQMDDAWSQLSGEVEVSGNVFGAQLTYNWKNLPWEDLPAL